MAAKIREARDEKQIKDYVPYREIVNCFNIQPGDVLLIGSDIRRLVLKAKASGEKFDTDGFIDSIKKAVGPQGTLMFPAYNFDFCKGKGFDFRNSLSEMGALSNRALERGDFVRTRHPIYSFAVAGKYAQHLAELENTSGFGAGSPFEFLHKNSGKMLIIGLDYQHSYTFVHYAEEMNRVDYRYSKEFSGNYTDQDGKTTLRAYSLYVRDLGKGVQTSVNPIGKVFEERGAAEVVAVNGVVFTLIDLKKSYDIVTEDIRSNQALNLHILEKRS